MTNTGDLRDLALHYHRLMPERIRAYLNTRGIPDELIHRHLFGWSGGRITIPIPNREGKIAFFKLAKDPEDASSSPKMYATPGSSGELYGWEVLARNPKRLLIAEGEFDRLVLEARGYDAVTSTAGAGSFRREWAEALASAKEIFICYDRDDAGRMGARRVADLIPQAKPFELPEEVGEGGDVTDFFVRLGRSVDDFERLLEAARPAPPPLPRPQTTPAASSGRAERVERIKEAVNIEDLVAQYVELRRSGKNLEGRCPFHDDENPSFVVFPETRTFYCFGCFQGGDVITFLRRWMNLSFSGALDALEKTLPTHERRRAA